MGGHEGEVSVSFKEVLANHLAQKGEAALWLYRLLWWPGAACFDWRYCWAVEKYFKNLFNPSDMPFIDEAEAEDYQSSCSH